MSATPSVSATQKTCFIIAGWLKDKGTTDAERYAIEFFKEKGFEVRTAREIATDAAILDGIIERIKSSSLVVVILNNTRQNVAFEYGIAKGAGVHVILLKEDTFKLEETFADLLGVQHATPFHHKKPSEVKRILKEDESVKAVLRKVEEEIIKVITTGDKKPPSQAVRMAAEALAAAPPQILGTKPIETGDLTELPRDMEGLIEAIELAKKETKGSAGFYFYLGNALSYFGKKEEAAKAYQDSIRINPDSAEAHNNYGFLLDELKRFEEAEREYKKAIRIKPDYAEAHYNYGVLLKKVKRFEEAEREYKKAIRIKPDYAEAHYNYGNLLGELKRFEDAEKESKEAIRIKPDYAEAHYNYGFLLDELKRFAEAEREYKEAIRIKPDDAEAIANLGILYNQLKRERDALKYLLEAWNLREQLPDKGERIRGLIEKLKKSKGTEK